MIRAALACTLALASGGAAQSDDWWRDAVFYEVFVRSFADSTEGPLAGDGVGDLRGLIERLDYLNDGDPETDTDLGVTAIWLMPIAESPSYHGYDVVDYRAIDDEYGTMEDMRELLEACRARGIRVIPDLVINHCADEHPWFQEAIDPASPKHDWFIWSAEDPGWRGPWGQEVWHDEVRDRNGLYYYGCFYHGMPDLNLRNPEVTRELYDIAEFWLTEVGVDGFRLDAIKHLIEDGAVQESTPETIAWLRRWQRYLKSVKPDMFTVGEVWIDSAEASKYVPDACDSVFEFDLGYATIAAVNAGDAGGLMEQLGETWRVFRPRGTWSSFLQNHDQDRPASHFGGDLDKCAIAATALLTMPGIPFIYYGEEIGQQGTKPDPNIRRPLQWSSELPGVGFTTGAPWRGAMGDVETVNIETQSADPDSLLSLYRRLIRLRDELPSLRRGDLRVLETDRSEVGAFLRTLDGQRVLVVLNLSGEAVEGYSIDAVGVPRRAGGVERLHGATVKTRSGRAWTPIERLEARTGYVVVVGE